MEEHANTYLYLCLTSPHVTSFGMSFSDVSEMDVKMRDMLIERLDKIRLKESRKSM